MPLTAGKSEEVVSDNIREMMHAFHRTGKIGNTTPRSAEHARLIATAAAYEHAGRSRHRGG